MTGHANIDKILNDKNYQVDHNNMHLTIDDLVVIKRQFDRQDEAIEELLKPLINQVAANTKDIGSLKEKVYVDHENRILALEAKVFKRRVALFGGAAAAIVISLLLMF